jgi:hypothetical protein
MTIIKNNYKLFLYITLYILMSFYDTNFSGTPEKAD